MPHQVQRLEHLSSEAPNESGREPDKAVGLDQFVEVDAQQFHSNAQVSTEVKVLGHLDDVVLLVLILQA